jgi:hypothetical protein
LLNKQLDVWYFAKMAPGPPDFVGRYAPPYQNNCKKLGKFKQFHAKYYKLSHHFCDIRLLEIHIEPVFGNKIKTQISSDFHQADTSNKLMIGI